MGVNMLIGIAIDAAVTAIDNFIHKAEKGREALNDFYNDAKEYQNELADQKEWIESNGKKYEELAKGVDKYGHNISLTTEEFSNYNSMTKEIADMFPTMIRGYNDQGNAILKNKGSVEELTKAYEENVDAYYASIRAKSGKTFSDYKDATSDYRKHKEKLDSLINKKQTVSLNDMRNYAKMELKNLFGLINDGIMDEV